MRYLSAFVIGFHVTTAAAPILAGEPAPRITDREIVERLTVLEGGQKNLDARMDDMNRRIDALERSLSARIDDTNRRIDALRADMMARFDLLTWLITLFVTIALVILGFVLRMQWQPHKRQTRVETSLETQKDEIAFLKSLIDKLLPPRTAL